MTTTDPKPDEPAVLSWLGSNIHRLHTIDPADDDFSDLEPLREIVGDARVVSIGAILDVPGVRGALLATPARIVGLSPIVGGRPLNRLHESMHAKVGFGGIEDHRVTPQTNERIDHAQFGL